MPSTYPLPFLVPFLLKTNKQTKKPNKQKRPNYLASHFSNPFLITNHSHLPGLPLLCCISPSCFHQLVFQYSCYASARKPSQLLGLLLPAPAGCGRQRGRPAVDLLGLLHRLLPGNHAIGFPGQRHRHAPHDRHSHTHTQVVTVWVFSRAQWAEVGFVAITIARVRVCVCVRARARACVCVCARVCV